mmetsp:Transcript_162014/g.519446  ORF Transcript_162014/g.519446 Transcript_162014/m.519446 type:complete len:294 (+) Transcript_162014:1251-2132(+)
MIPFSIWTHPDSDLAYFFLVFDEVNLKFVIGDCGGLTLPSCASKDIPGSQAERLPPAAGDSGCVAEGGLAATSVGCKRPMAAIRCDKFTSGRCAATAFVAAPPSWLADSGTVGGEAAPGVGPCSASARSSPPRQRRRRHRRQRCHAAGGERRRLRPRPCARQRGRRRCRVGPDGRRCPSRAGAARRHRARTPRILCVQALALDVPNHPLLPAARPKFRELAVPAVNDLLILGDAIEAIVGHRLQQVRKLPRTHADGGQVVKVLAPRLGQGDVGLAGQVVVSVAPGVLLPHRRP